MSLSETAPATTHPVTQQPETEAPGSPVSLTAKAAEKVKEIRGEENIEDTYALRLKVQGGGCSGFSYDLYFDLPQDIDHSFEVSVVVIAGFPRCARSRLALPDLDAVVLLEAADLSLALLADRAAHLGALVLDRLVEEAIVDGAVGAAGRGLAVVVAHPLAGVAGLVVKGQ